MAIIRWDPFREFDRFFSDDWGLVPMWKGSSQFRLPAIDVYQTDKDVVAELEVPAGIDPERIEISVEDGTLTLRGRSEERREEKDKHYYRKEIHRGEFERSVALPTAVKSGEAEATYEKGILKVTIPRAEESKPRKVEVKIKK